MKVLIMGLGLHGGGLESARYLLKHGADLTITDLRDEKTLTPSIEQLEGAAIRYVLGKHETDDFINADMVIKNPGVRSDSPFLQAARTQGSGRIETDISLFLAASPARLTAVTGSKGKSTTASAIHWVLAQNGTAYLGGNITVSPLSFLDNLTANDDAVLELSSWQLGDLRGRLKADAAPGLPLLKPKVAVLTPIMSDHLDYYGTMEAYVADKRVIYQGQDKSDFIITGNDAWGKSFRAESTAQPLVYSGSPLPQGVLGGWIDGPGLARLYSDEQSEIVRLVRLFPEQPKVPGLHQKQNLLAAGLALLALGVPPEKIYDGLEAFPGVEHRLEPFYQARGITFYNDSAATIPEAAAAAIDALGSERRLILVSGGTDKNLDFAPLAQAAHKAQAIILLAGSGSEKLITLLAKAGIPYCGPFDNLDTAVTAALEKAAPGGCVLLSPGCASFGMFLNEFDRGRKWKEAIMKKI